MRVDNILGKLMAITRGIHLMVPSSYERMDAFNSGGGTSMGLRQVTWWVTHKAIVETRELAGMIRKIDREYAEASVAAIQLEIDRVLKANLDDSDLFDLRRVTRGASTLFDAIAADDKRGVARNLWNKILSAVKDLQPRWLVLYPLRGVVADSVDAAYSSADESLQRRAITACQFIHHAIMADGFERFVHYYIALDAMFGERYKVEENVKGALLRMFPNDPLWSYRADHLFDLRNELIHGGTSSLDKWKGLEAYIRHVKTSPLEDVGRAAMTALRNYFVSPPKFVTT